MNRGPKADNSGFTRLCTSIALETPPFERAWPVLGSTPSSNQKNAVVCGGGGGGGVGVVVWVGGWLVVSVVVKSIFPVDVWGCALEQTKNRSFPLSSLHLVGHGRREGAEPRAYFWVAENWPLPRLFVLELFKSNNDRACTHLTSGLVRTNGSKTVRSN